jgi:hypothetical protein
MRKEENMATVVNNPSQSDNNGMGFLIGVVVLIVFLILFFVYILPMITQSMQGPSVTVPDQVDVNVSTPEN